MVLVDASTRWSHVCLLSTRNAVFAKLLAQIIKLRAHHPNYPIKSIRLDNAGEFMSQTFDDYCMSVGIDVEHHVPHVLGRSFHKAPTIDSSYFGYENQTAEYLPRAMQYCTQLCWSDWGPPLPNLIYRYSWLLDTSLMSHIYVCFSMPVYVPIAPPLHTKMDP